MANARSPGRGAGSEESVVVKMQHGTGVRDAKPVNGWTLGNGTTTSRTYDTDGNVRLQANGQTCNYDNDFRITGITDTSIGSYNWTYDYDTLDRITSGTRASVTSGWTYDANGNRLTETASAPSTYSISPTSNQITAITGALARTYGYDAAGNTTQGNSTESIVYNALGRGGSPRQGGFAYVR